MPLYLVLFVAVTFRHSCSPVIAWRRIVLHFIDLKQLLRVSCFLRCYLSKWFSTILQNTRLWCYIFVCLIFMPTMWKISRAGNETQIFILKCEPLPVSPGQFLDNNSCMRTVGSFIINETAEVTDEKLNHRNSDDII